MINICEKELQERKCNNCRKEWDNYEAYKEVQGKKYCVECGELKKSIIKGEKDKGRVLIWFCFIAILLVIGFFIWMNSLQKKKEKEND